MFKTILCSLSLGMTFLVQAQQLDRAGALKDFQMSVIPITSLSTTMAPPESDFLQPLPNGHLLYAQDVFQAFQMPYWSLSVLDTQLKVVAQRKFKFKDFIGSKETYESTMQRLGDKIYWIVELDGDQKKERKIGCFEVEPNATVLPPKIVASGPHGLNPDYLGHRLGYQVVGDKLVTYSAVFDEKRSDYACDIRVYDADLKLLKQKKFTSKERWFRSQFVLDADLTLYMLSFSNYIEAAQAKESSSGVQYNQKKSNNYAFLHLLRVDDTQFTNLAVDWKYLPRRFQVVSKPLSNELILVGTYNNMPSWDAPSKQWYYWEGTAPKRNEASGLFYFRFDLPSAKGINLNYEPTAETVSKFENPNATPAQIKNGLGTMINKIQFMELKEHLVVATTLDEDVSSVEERTTIFNGKRTSTLIAYECYSIGVTIFDKSGKMVSQQVLPRRLHAVGESYASFKLLKHEDEAVLIYHDHPKNRSKIPQTSKEVKRGSVTAIQLPVETRWTALNLNGTITHSPVFDPNGSSYCMRTNLNYTWLVNPNQLWSIVRRANLSGELYLAKIQK